MITKDLSLSQHKRTLSLLFSQVRNPRKHPAAFYTRCSAFCGAADFRPNPTAGRPPGRPVYFQNQDSRPAGRLNRAVSWVSPVRSTGRSTDSGRELASSERSTGRSTAYSCARLCTSVDRPVDRTSARSAAAAVFRRFFRRRLSPTSSTIP